MRLTIVPLLLFVLFSCRNDQSKEAVTPPQDSTKFFQVADFIKSQIKEINTTPYYIYKLEITDGKKDSTAVTGYQIQDLTNQFIQPDINDAALKSSYKESVFFDQTTKNFSINYSSIDKDLPLQNVDILLEEDGKKVKRIFLRKFFNYPDSSAIEQLTWKPDESFEINRLVQLPSKKEISHQTIVTWNAKVKEL